MPTLEENVNRVKAAKTAIGNAITAKGGTVGANDGLEDFAADIASIPSGGGVEFSNTPTTFSLIGNINNLDVVVPNGIISISNDAFKNCEGLKSIIFPDTVEVINANAFYNCNKLANVEFGNNINTIGSSGFMLCTSLTNITIPNSVTNIGTYAFANCTSLTDITLPNTLTTISAYTFADCTSLTNITIPNTLTTIANSAFQSCTSLKSIEIPNAVTSIGRYAFRYCSGLKSIKFTPTTPPTIGGTNTFQSVPTNCIIYVPTGTLSVYTSASNYPDPNTYTYVEY